MGFVLSVFYFVTHYLTPAYLFGPLASWHIEEIVVVLVFLVSIPAFIKSFLLRTPQTLALIGLAIAVFLSSLITQRWLGGGVKGVQDFIPNALSYFLVCLHCTTKKRLQILIFLLLCVCLIVIAHGCVDLHRGVADSGPAPGVGIDEPLAPGATASPYLMRQRNGAGEWNFRLQGLGEINDPNDFGQLMVCLVPLMFIFWKPGSTARNVAFVFLPVSALLFGVFLTHSRGALLALVAIVLVAARRRIGTIPAAVMAAGLFIAAMALQFTGGRDISASAGEDRTALWGQGMALFKAHPVFGVGYGHLWEYTESYLTAHNSVIVCAAELGLLGLYFWSLFLYSTMRDALAVASPKNVTAAQPIVEEQTPFPRAILKMEELEPAEINRLGRVLFISLTGFLVAGWFLSRAFVATLFLLGGMTESIYEMALRRGMIGPRLPLLRVLRDSAILAVILITTMYILVRLLNLAR